MTQSAFLPFFLLFFCKFKVHHTEKLFSGKDIVIYLFHVLLHIFFNISNRMNTKHSTSTILQNLLAKTKCTPRKRLHILIVALPLLALFLLTTAITLLPISTKSEDCYVFIDSDDNIDSVRQKIRHAVDPLTMKGFDLLSCLLSYNNNVRTGRYKISPHVSSFSLVKMLRGKHQTPVDIVIPTTWTKEMALGRIAKKIMADSAELSEAFNDSTLYSKYGLDSNTVTNIFLPYKHELFWDISPEDLMEKLYKQYNVFWDSSRKAKAEKLHMTEAEVISLASIVDAETANDSEKPLIAGLYINRLNKGMPLQSDPTVKYALKDFGLRRIYSNMLRTSSPYNTYINKGLPPGPIRTPSVAGIDAVLNHKEHCYLYMCAKEDFSGTHNFATTYKEHLLNARKYTSALNNRNIR